MKQIPSGDWAERLLRTSPWPKYSFQMPSWQAHRGYWKGGQPQNSLEALISAREKGASMCEFDVRLTLDRVPVLFHDDTFATDDGRKLAVDRLTLKELRGHRKVSTLDEVLASDRVTPFLNIELKSEKVLDEPLERFVAPLIEKHLAHHRVMFSSFNPFSLWKMSHYLPDVPRGLLVSPDMKERSLREMWWGLVIPVHILHLDHEMVTESKMQRWQAQHVPIAVWTVNDPVRMQSLRDWGVQSIISDEIPPWI